MKKMIALLLILLVSVGLISSSFASASSELSTSTQTTAKGAYSSTQQFTAIMDENGIYYTYYGVDSDNDDVVYVGLDYDDISLTARIYFGEDGEDCALRVWDIIAYDEVMEMSVMQACNTLNRSYRYICFYADTDYTVTASMDLIFHDGDDIGMICLVGLLRLYSIIEEAYPDLAVFSN